MYIIEEILNNAYSMLNIPITVERKVGSSVTEWHLLRQ